ncbi:MAG: transglutaminase family protein [Sulfuritalea sp.]|jgi:transglutaminase-like putative cysteine protease|nr:transglutaminase family protein [Sulfuritalea sp.]
MLLSIEHHTRYAYSEVVNYTIQQLRLTPQNGFGQHVKRWDIKVIGALNPTEDTYGNSTHALVIDTPHQEISIVAMGEIETGLEVISQHQNLPLPIYLRDTPLTKSSEAICLFAIQFKTDQDGQLAALEAMMHTLLECVNYIKGATQVTTSAIEAFELGQGVCQDHAHIFISCCRSIGLPARYVSGYLFTVDGSLMQTHAWADVYLSNIGWQSFDVSNGCRAGETHVRLATGLDYRSASPVSGMRSGGGVEGMATSVIVNQSGVPLTQQRRIDTKALAKNAEMMRQAQQIQQ